MQDYKSVNVAVKKEMLTASCMTESDEINDCKCCGTLQYFTSNKKLECVISDIFKPGMRS